jgi:glycosyltransferase involved in cell wall biosynthesis
VIPTADRPRLARRAIASAAGQEAVKVEIIVVDDGAIDSTRIEPAAHDHPGLRVLRTCGRQGPAVARNRGIAAAKGAWTAFLDDDDYWRPDKLRRQLAAAEAAGADFAYAAALHVDASGGVLALVEAPSPSDLEALLPDRNAIPAAASNVIARTQVLRTLGGFDETLWHFSDWELCQRLARRVPGAAVSEPLVAYLQHPVNLRARGTVGMMRELQRLDSLRPRPSRRRADRDRLLLLRWVSGAHRDTGRRLRAAGVDLRIAATHRSPADLARGLLTLLSPRAEQRMRERWTSRSRVALEVPEWVSRQREARP